MKFTQEEFTQKITAAVEAHITATLVQPNLATPPIGDLLLAHKLPTSLTMRLCFAKLCAYKNKQLVVVEVMEIWGLMNRAWDEFVRLNTD